LIYSAPAVNWLEPTFPQLPPPDLPFGYALEAGSLEVVGFHASPGASPAIDVGTPAAVFADLDPELDGLRLGIPVGVFGGRCWETVRRALSCSMPGSHEEHIREGARCQRQARSMLSPTR